MYTRSYCFFVLMCLNVLNIHSQQLISSAQISSGYTLNSSDSLVDLPSVSFYRGIIKADPFAPFLNSIYISYQYQPLKKVSMELGVGLIGNWNTMYILTSKNNGAFLRFGIYILHARPQMFEKSSFKSMYLKPEIVLMYQNVESDYKDRAYDQPTGSFKEISVKDTYSIQGRAFFLNAGQQIDFGHLIVDCSFGVGVNTKTCTFSSNEPIFNKVSNNQNIFYQNVYYSISLNDINVAYQLSLKMGWKVK